MVPEYAPTGSEPDGTDRDRQASYWTTVNSQRWRCAVELERCSNVVLCDSDPLKLHYSWCLARVGADSRARFAAELREVRAALADGGLRLADLVLVSIPPLELLRRQREADSSRRRRSFELHARLAEPLRDWYEAMDQAGVAQVHWPFSRSVAAAAPDALQRNRSDPLMLDRLVERLPGSIDL